MGRRSPSALPLIVVSSRECPGSRSFQGRVSKGEAQSTRAQVWWAGHLLLLDQSGGLALGTLPGLQLVVLAWRDKVL